MRSTKLSGYTPNAEAIAAYKPDLVVTADDTNHVVEALRKLGIQVLVDPPAQNLDAAYAQLEQLGRATGHDDEARRVVTRMRARMAAIAKRPGFAKVAAVRRNAVLAVPDDLASHWGPRIVDFLDLVARQVREMGA